MSEIIKSILRILLDALSQLLSPLLILALIIGWDTRQAVIAKQIQPDTYLVCSVIMFVGWWLSKESKVKL